MKKRKTSEIKWLILIKSHYFITLILCGIHTACQSNKCEVLEHYNNGLPKLEMCTLNEQENYYRYKEFYDNSNIKIMFYLLNEKLEGEVIEYFQTGKIKSKSIYRNGLKNGDHYEFSEDGKIDVYNYFVNDQAVYIKDYQYSLNNTINFEEGFIPILDFKQNSDTIFCNENSLNFKISIPLPDSILKSRNLTYKFGVKPLSLKDSIIIDSPNEIVLNNRKTIDCTVKLKPTVTQIFYGYTMDEKQNHIYQPFEKVVVLLR